MNYQLYMGSVDCGTKPSGQVRAFRLCSSLNPFLFWITVAEKWVWKEKILEDLPGAL